MYLWPLLSLLGRLARSSCRKWPSNLYMQFFPFRKKNTCQPKFRCVQTCKPRVRFDANNTCLSHTHAQLATKTPYCWQYVQTQKKCVWFWQCFCGGPRPVRILLCFNCPAAKKSRYIVCMSIGLLGWIVPNIIVPCPTYWNHNQPIFRSQWKVTSSRLHMK